MLGLIFLSSYMSEPAVIFFYRTEEVVTVVANVTKWLPAGTIILYNFPLMVIVQKEV